MKDCMLCKIDAAAADEQQYRALYFLLGRHGTPNDPLCEKHIYEQAFCLPTLAAITGHGEYADKIRDALNAPPLRLVTTSASTEKKP